MINRKRGLSIAIKILVSTGLLALLLVFRTSPAEIWSEIRGADPFWLSLSFSLHALGLLISAVRWRILITAQGDHAPLGFLIRSYLVGTFFNTLLPSRIGGDVVRIWDGSRISRTLVRSSAIILVERLTGIVMLLAFALGASLFRLDMARRTPVIWASLFLGAAGLATILLPLLPVTEKLLAGIPKTGRPGRAAGKLLELRQTILAYRDRRDALVRALFWAGLLQVNVILHFFLIGKALHLPIAFLDYFIFIPIVLLVQLIPVTINGLGLREGAYTEIFSLYGISAGAALSFSLIDVAFMLLVGLVGGVVYITRRRFSPPKELKPPDDA
jgi:glycosyltransferase 2 family protein